MTNNKLIYIEDDQILGNLITQALAENGFEVDFRTTLNGLQDSLLPCSPDLLILDIKVNNQKLPRHPSSYPLTIPATPSYHSLFAYRRDRDHPELRHRSQPLHQKTV